MQGVTPATIAVKDGVCRVGLTSEDLEDLALSGKEGRATKCSTRDLPVVMSAQKKESNGDHHWGGATFVEFMFLYCRLEVLSHVYIPSCPSSSYMAQPRRLRLP